MSATRESTPPIVPDGTPGVLAQVVDVVVDPRAAFRAIASRPTWAGALLVLIGIRFSSLFVFYQPATEPGKLVAGVAFQFATIVPMVIASATVLWVSGRVWSVAISRSIALSIAVHVTLAYTIATIAIASAAGAFLPASTDVDLREPPFVNLSVLATPDMSPVLARGLGEIDIRSAYAIVLVALGVRGAVPAAARRRVAAAVATCVVVRVVAVLWSAM